jgi:predicted nucleotide-binding protein
MGEPLTMRGKVVYPGKIDRIRIGRSKEPIDAVIKRLQNEDHLSHAPDADGPSLQGRALDQAEDVTDQFITDRPGSEAPVNTLSVPAGPGDKRSIFVVKGRSNEAISALEEMLRTLDLKIIDWEEAVEREGSPNPYVGDVVFTGLKMADAVLVILTPDDLVLLRPDLLDKNDGHIEQTLQGQARPNVIYEAGIADAYGRNRTVIVAIGPVKSFSDIEGRNIVRYDSSPKQRKVLVERLRRAGLEPNIVGTDWLEAGDVRASIEKAQQAIDKARQAMLSDK